jgi:hypothetical protein
MGGRILGLPISGDAVAIQPVRHRSAYKHLALVGQARQSSDVLDGVMDGVMDGEGWGEA